MRKYLKQRIHYDAKRYVSPYAYHGKVKQPYEVKDLSYLDKNDSEWYGISAMARTRIKELNDNNIGKSFNERIINTEQTFNNLVRDYNPIIDVSRIKIENTADTAQITRADNSKIDLAAGITTIAVRTLAYETFERLLEKNTSSTDQINQKQLQNTVNKYLQELTALNSEQFYSIFSKRSTRINQALRILEQGNYATNIAKHIIFERFKENFINAINHYSSISRNLFRGETVYEPSYIININKNKDEKIYYSADGKMLSDTDMEKIIKYDKSSHVNSAVIDLPESQTYTVSKHVDTNSNFRHYLNNSQSSSYVHGSRHNILRSARSTLRTTAFSDSSDDGFRRPIPLSDRSSSPSTDTERKINLRRLKTNSSSSDTEVSISEKNINPKLNSSRNNVSSPIWHQPYSFNPPLSPSTSFAGSSKRSSYHNSQISLSSSASSDSSIGVKSSITKRESNNSSSSRLHYEKQMLDELYDKTHQKNSSHPSSSSTASSDQTDNSFKI